MLTEVEQQEIIDRAMELMNARVRHNRMVFRHEMSPMRARELFDRKVNDFRKYLKEVGHVPVSAVPLKASNVVQSDQAQTQDGPQSL